ncbi:Ran guanine nucleotide release factor [Hondaea fermentalgiana]|uniref:Ran guanine nucleotide release factor n=1 Tax=Hondaea fermentalgiana TaxID=2315210 RepID=A0A2R5GLU9_9STRA|nr:Ran guanine nucleotide release factor [Hondaea fermentalgiana]|eukprot:GBG31605.1 Ran guanine nucleotide release factor [Hondaea fermentalgiana]
MAQEAAAGAAPTASAAKESETQSKNGLIFAKRELFGGAITASLPAAFADVSTVREVPDHQEVFADQNTDRSIIVEVLELTASESNETAGKYFFEDLAGANGSEATVIEYSEVGVPATSVPCLDKVADPAAASNVVIGTQVVAKFRESAKNTIRVFLCNIRLPKYTTDILISLNAPVKVSAESSSAASLQAAGAALDADPSTQSEDLQIFRKFIQSFVIENVALFGG